MTEKSRAKELVGYSFLVVFANDDTIDERARHDRAISFGRRRVDDKKRKFLEGFLIAWITTQSPAKSWKRSTARKQHDI